MKEINTSQRYSPTSAIAAGEKKCLKI